jgi:hypothetical protein
MDPYLRQINIDFVSLKLNDYYSSFGGTSYDLGWCSTHFSGEKLKATAHLSERAVLILLLKLLQPGYQILMPTLITTISLKYQDAWNL